MCALSATVAPAESRMRAEHVSHVIDANIVEPDFAKALGQPRSARRFAKRRRRNSRHFHLPLRQLRLLRRNQLNAERTSGEAASRASSCWASCANPCFVEDAGSGKSGRRGFGLM